MQGLEWGNNRLSSELYNNQFTFLPSTVFSGLNALATLFVSMMQIVDDDDDDPKHPCTVFMAFEGGIIDFTVSLKKMMMLNGRGSTDDHDADDDFFVLLLTS